MKQLSAIKRVVSELGEIKRGQEQSFIDIILPYSNQKKGGSLKVHGKKLKNLHENANLKVIPLVLVLNPSSCFYDPHINNLKGQNKRKNTDGLFQFVLLWSPKYSPL